MADMRGKMVALIRQIVIPFWAGEIADHLIANDVIPVVRCQNCVHSEPFDRNCELNSTAYMHCRILRGEETKNVWHKYKKYYKDYSVVDRDGFCDEGERREEDG